MKTSTTTSEREKAVEAGKRAPKVNKACVPCRTRKVKCDAAVVGLPCSSCRSQQRTHDCVPLVRRVRTRKSVHVSSTVAPIQTAGSPIARREPQRQSENQSQAHPTPDSQVRQSPGQPEPDLLYLRILNDAVEETPGSGHTVSSTHRPRLEEGLTPRNCQSSTLSRLDHVDREYLSKKDVFDLPPHQHLDTFVKTFFAYVHPFCPVINRVDFVRCYKSGDCSLLLLFVVLTLASVHAQADLLSACGFSDRSAAQESFFSRARLLHDLAAEDDPLVMLQASIILTLVILDHPTDHDFGYWFHNAIRLATKLNLRDIVSESNKTREELKVYRRAWWGLESLDVFHVFINPRRSRLLDGSSSIKFRTEDDWEDEEALGDSYGLFSPVTPQQKASPVVLNELTRLSAECLSVMKSQKQEDPRRMMHPLDTWRSSLAYKMHIGGTPETDVYYLNARAMSYRFECISCRWMRRTWQRSGRAEWSEWARQRLRSAVLELDTIMMRVLASGSLDEFPTPFITTITALFALHIETALDPTETDLVRSLSRISTSQIMLVVNAGKEIPVLKRALPVFEEILMKNNLSLQPPTQDSNGAHASASPGIQIGGNSLPMEQWDNNPSLDIDFLGLDFLDDWQQFVPLDFST